MVAVRTPDSVSDPQFFRAKGVAGINVATPDTALGFRQQPAHQRTFFGLFGLIWFRHGIALLPWRWRHGRPSKRKHLAIPST